MDTMLPAPLDFAALVRDCRACASCRYYAIHPDTGPAPWWCARHGVWHHGDPTLVRCNEHARGNRDAP